MCQLLFNEDDADLGADEVVDILEDGVHPGKKVVSGEGWDSTPLDGWRIIDLPGVPASRFHDLKRVELGPDNELTRRRAQRVELTGPQRAALDASKRLTGLREVDLDVRTSTRVP